MTFDSSAKRCNLLIGTRHVNQRQVNTVVEIYDSRTNSWTKYQMTTRPSVNPLGEGIYSKGTYYWINETHVGYSESRYDVVGFNVQRGRWELIWHPPTLYRPRGQLQFWQLSGCDGRVVLVFKNNLSFWKLNEDEAGDYDGRRSKWSALPTRRWCDGSDEDFRRQVSAQVVASCSGWILVYFPKKTMAVLDGEGRIVRQMEGEELHMLGDGDGCPTSVHIFEANNVWWPPSCTYPTLIPGIIFGLGLCRSWENLVDEWMKTAGDIATAGTSSDSVSGEGINEENGLPAPPLDGGAFFSAQTTSIELSQGFVLFNHD